MGNGKMSLNTGWSFKTGSTIPLFHVCKIKLRKLVIGRVLISIFSSGNRRSRSVFETIVMGLSRGPVTISTVIVILNTEPQVPQTVFW